MTEITEKRAHFIRQLITDELASGKHKSVVTRFPPEPNGYLHVGHAKSYMLEFWFGAGV
ncbi:glutamine tRNA synthetase [Legionella cherrii]|uniref:Glutamine tRNA synthetase n=1 Tax=Legionella cherrii TaxID=28084 RepID=A0ABY6T7S2_9GAMM|nr:glutamate--tRNA ligase family protein [Legionella cherrii]VEB36971.1 glutamine tRNA synthetase [Legionella cherrii]